MEKSKSKFVLWFTGLSGSGKTTIGNELRKELLNFGYEKIIVLDGDDLRRGINSNLDYSDKDRSEANRRAAEIAKILFKQGYTVIVTTISPFKKDREVAKKIISNKNFKIIFINATLETCKRRDIKGLYKQAMNGRIKKFTGIDSPYEEPKNANITINTQDNNISSCIKFLIEKLIQQK